MTTMTVQERVVNVGAVYGAAQAYVHLNQTPKAKLILKKVWSPLWFLKNFFGSIFQIL